MDRNTKKMFFELWIIYLRKTGLIMPRTFWNSSPLIVSSLIGLIMLFWDFLVFSYGRLFFLPGIVYSPRPDPGFTTSVFTDIVPFCSIALFPMKVGENAVTWLFSSWIEIFRPISFRSSSGEVLELLPYCWDWFLRLLELLMSMIPFYSRDIFFST